MSPSRALEVRDKYNRPTPPALDFRVGGRSERAIALARQNAMLTPNAVAIAARYTGLMQRVHQPSRTVPRKDHL